MSDRPSFNERYAQSDTPWDTGRADCNLVSVVETTPICACKALDIGCGTGANCRWLAEQGFSAVGCDISDIAIAKAKQTHSPCAFHVIDFMEQDVPGAPFDFLFDRGCFHSFREDAARSLFAQRAADHLAAGGLWLSLIGNADEHREGSGPPQCTAQEIARAVEPAFEMLALVSTHLDSDSPIPPRAWRCLMRKRHPAIAS